MKLKDCLPGRIVKMREGSSGSSQNKIGQIVPGLRKNSHGEVVVLVQWAEDPDAYTIHPWNIELIK